MSDRRYRTVHTSDTTVKRHACSTWNKACRSLRRHAQAAEELVELVERGVVDDQLAFVLPGCGADLDAEAQLSGEVFLEVLDVGGGGLGRALLGPRRLLHHALQVPDRQTLEKHEVRKALLFEQIGDAGDELGVADRQASVTDHVSDRL